MKLKPEFEQINIRIIRFIEAYRARLAGSPYAAALFLKYFVLTVDDGLSFDVDFVLAHGCAGTGNQFSIRSKLELYYRAIKNVYPSAHVMHFLLGDNVYEHGCQTQRGNDLQQYFKNIYYDSGALQGFKFPWDICFGILGNHDYNYVNPLLKKLYGLKYFYRSASHGPAIASNQIAQSYELYLDNFYRQDLALVVDHPTDIYTPLIPSRYYAVNTRFAIHICLDTNVLLFDIDQQAWLNNLLDRISADDTLKTRFLIINCHQPLQTFGKRSKDNGDSNYYFENVTDPDEKKALNDLLFELIPISVYEGKGGKAKIPLGFLLRRYLERAFTTRGLRIAMVVSAHDHFNECSYFGAGILQVISGVTGIEKDPQNDARTIEEIEALKRRKPGDTSVVPAQIARRKEAAEPILSEAEELAHDAGAELARDGAATPVPGSTLAPASAPAPGMLAEDTVLLTPPPSSAPPPSPSSPLSPSSLSSLSSLSSPQQPRGRARINDIQLISQLLDRIVRGELNSHFLQNLSSLNDMIRLQITLPLFILSKEIIKIFWVHPYQAQSQPPEQQVTLTKPIVLLNPSSRDILQELRFMLNKKYNILNGMRSYIFLEILSGSDVHMSQIKTDFGYVLGHYTLSMQKYDLYTSSSNISKKEEYNISRQTHQSLAMQALSNLLNSTTSALAEGGWFKSSFFTTIKKTFEFLSRITRKID